MKSNKSGSLTAQDIENIKSRFLKEIEKETEKEEKKRICKKYIEEELSSVFSLIKNLGEEKRIDIGKRTNELRFFINEKLKEAKEEADENYDSLDVSFPGDELDMGTIHPLTKTIEDCVDIFSKMGFAVVEGPELVNEWYNFDALNFKKDHPVREMQDTLFIKQKDREELNEREKLLMRTHTSAAQVLYMENRKPPFRIVVPGRVFRNEATDNSHEINFYHLEGLMIGDNISVASFKAVVETFFKEFFSDNVEIRLRSSYFPFTEPSFEIDLSCTICNKKGCSTCQNTGWLEMMGAGMVHPNVLRSAKIDPEKYVGFAFGVGVDRMAMVKHKIDNIRLFYGGDLRFLKQF